MQSLPSSAEIRQFLFEFFSDDELTSLCFDYFPQVYDDFAASMTKQHKTRMLLEYCQHRELVPNLIGALQRARPEVYAERFPQAPKTKVRLEPVMPVRDPKQVFISHAQEDAEFAHRLLADLKQGGWRVWIAPDSIRPGEKWVEAINRGLEESGVFVLALTPSAVKSQWVMDEANVAIECEHEGQVRFVPLMVEPCEVPPLWRAYQRVPFQSDYGSGLTALFDALEPERRAQRKREAQEKAAREEAERPANLVARKADADRRQQERQARFKRILKNLRDPLWQGIGALVALVALAVALGAWLWPTLSTALFPPLTPTSTIAPTATAVIPATPPLTLSPTTSSTLTPTAARTPAPTQTAASTPAATSLADCKPTAQFVSETVPDNTQFDKGAAFTKTWRVRSSGTCDWPADTALVFVAGDKLGADQTTISVGAVKAGDTADISVNLKAPNEDAAKWTGHWKLQGGGSALAGGLDLTVVIVTGNPVVATSPPPKPTWTVVIVTKPPPGAGCQVSTTADSGPGSLRQALADAAPGDTICFAPALAGQTITLGSTLTIGKNLTIDGSSLVSPISVSGNNAVRVFMVNRGVTATLKSLKVAHGYVASEEGAGLQNNGVLTIVNSTFDSNASGYQGGGLTNLGTLTVQGSTFSNNTSVECAAGINNGGNLTVLSSAFIANHATGCGGGIGGGNPYVVANSTFYGNISNGWQGGGALFINTTGITVVNSTLYGNVATGGPGGGISLEHNYEVLNLSNTIIANSTGGDCYNPGSLGVAQNNLIQDSTNACGLTNGVNGNLIGQNPNLGALADNGGRTQTMALLPGSPAIDAGNDATCAAAPVNGLDQRGVARPQGAHCDIGAYEVKSTP